MCKILITAFGISFKILIIILLFYSDVDRLSLPAPRDSVRMACSTWRSRGTGLGKEKVMGWRWCIVFEVQRWKIWGRKVYKARQRGPTQSRLPVRVQDDH